MVFAETPNLLTSALAGNRTASPSRTLAASTHTQLDLVCVVSCSGGMHECEKRSWMFSPKQAGLGRARFCSPSDWFGLSLLCLPSLHERSTLLLVPPCSVPSLMNSSSLLFVLIAFSICSLFLRIPSGWLITFPAKFLSCFSTMPGELQWGVG